MSSFTSSDNFDPSNCEVDCAHIATWINWNEGGDFDDEVQIFNNCVNSACSNK